jgi:signal transduction histidine kinase
MDNPNEFVYIIFYILLFLILVIVAIVLFITKSRKKIFEKEIEKKDLEIKLQKDVLQATILSQETERNRIAKDLHDEISSKLIAVSLNLHLLESAKTQTDAKTEIIENIIKINQSTIENARKIAHDLLPPVLEKFGLNAAIEELILNYNHSKAIHINFKSVVDFKPFSNQKQLQIFRIIQELVNNSIKHGKATQIQLDFVNEKQTIQCNYSDNGLGFDTKDKTIKKGLGMRNIESRIDFLNSSYTINSQKNKGFQFQFNFEIEQ